ncbi:DNA adenine methylase, partial [Candidatus Saccharibacteria bacterium]|nr:DNA adenine methylase [Candidatus Saccharibacteria bacterium]
MKYFAILGRQPKISYAELESLFGSENVSVFSADIAILETELNTNVCQRLGSIIKICEVVSEQSYTNWPKLSQNIIHTFSKIGKTYPDGKITIGISLYGLNIKLKDLEKTGLSAKKVLKASGRPIRLVPNKQAFLSTPQVIHNKLLTTSGIELVAVASGTKLLLGKTIYEQDIEAYTARDQARPKRDAYIGMLPPKLAQTIINLAAGPINIVNETEVNTNSTLLDPFCGTGVVLQEALLMGYSVIGTDINPKMIDYSIENISWLKDKYPEATNHYVRIELGDAQEHQWPKDVAIVAGETYLGQPISMIPDPEKLTRLVNETNSLHKRSLANLAKQLAPGTRICLAVPTWRTKKGFKHLPTLDQLGEIGYNRIEFKHTKLNDLIYIRENQFVGRELVVLTV